jgi:hypothetical protein
MKRITLKQADISPTLWRKIKNHAISGFYRINAQSADLYTFYTIDGKDFGGGWAWLDYPDTWDSDLAISLNDGKLYQLINKECTI